MKSTLISGLTLMMVWVMMSCAAPVGAMADVETVEPMLIMDEAVPLAAMTKAISNTFSPGAILGTTSEGEQVPPLNGWSYPGLNPEDEVGTPLLTPEVIPDPFSLSTVPAIDGEHEVSGMPDDGTEGADVLPPLATEPEAEDPMVGDAAAAGAQGAEEEPARPGAERAIIVERDMPTILRSGDKFYIHATLVGFEDADYTLRWQYDAGDGWRDYEVGGGTTLEVKSDGVNVDYGWRLLAEIAVASELES